MVLATKAKKGRFGAATRARKNSPTTPISHAGPCLNCWYVSLRHVGGPWCALYVARTRRRLRPMGAQSAECAVRARRTRTADPSPKLTHHVVVGLASASRGARSGFGYAFPQD